MCIYGNENLRIWSFSLGKIDFSFLIRANILGRHLWQTAGSRWRDGVSAGPLSMTHHTKREVTMKKYIFLAITSLAMLFPPTTLDAQSLSEGKQDSAIVTLSVSPQQEKNFNAFMAWLEAHPSLSQNDSLKQVHRSVFAAMKKNNAREYLAEKKRLEGALAKISSEVKQDLYKFFLALSPMKKSSSTAAQSGTSGGGGRCNVDCLFGSCSIGCPAGTKPKCQCHSGEPDCGCEP